MRRSNRDADRIIELFVNRQPAYGRATVLRLLNISDEALSNAIRAGMVAPEQNDKGVEVFSWEDVALLALEQWTPRLIQETLGTVETMAVIPLLNQHRVIPVSLPLYLIRLLDHLARSESRHMPRNASDIIERILHDFANAQDTTAIDLEIPGFLHALEYPTYTPPQTGLVSYRCRYCNVAISDAQRTVCQACKARHEPESEKRH